MTDATCPQRDGWGMACGRPVKRNGKCGIHANADEKRAAGRANREAARRERARRADEADRYCHRLRALGVACTTDGEHVYLTDPAALVAVLTAAVTPEGN